MSPAILLGLFLMTISAANSDVQCEGVNCRPRPVTLLPASTQPTSTPHPTTHKPTPANHTTPTPANHTTPAPANHTTVAPANHTTHSVPPTTVHPTTPPVLKKGIYKITDNTSTCAMAALKLQLRVQYRKGKKETAWGVFIIQPSRTNPSGSCGKTSVNMTLTFPEGSLTFGFKMNSKEKTFYLSEIQSVLKYKFPGSSEASTYTAMNGSVEMLKTHLGHSFQCSNQSVKAKSSFWVDLVDQQLQVFNISKNQEFGSAEVCPEDKRLPVVAIVVAVVLVLLILIVIVAYLIGRKRNPAGYQSI